MMSCRKSLEIEFTEFLADPRAAGFAEFRAHYPRCAECAAEVRAWTELHGRLSAAHSDPEQLARYEALVEALRKRGHRADRHVTDPAESSSNVILLSDDEPSCRKTASVAVNRSPRPITIPSSFANRKVSPGLTVSWVSFELRLRFSVFPT